MSARPAQTLVISCWRPPAQLGAPAAAAAPSAPYPHNPRWAGRSVDNELPFKKIMAANRGEISIRITRAGVELGLKTVGAHAAHSAVQRDRPGSIPSLCSAMRQHTTLPCWICTARSAQASVAAPKHSGQAVPARGAAEPPTTTNPPTLPRPNTAGYALV